MNTRIHTTREGRIIVQRELVDLEKPRWLMCAGPYGDRKLARQGQLRFLRKHEIKIGTSLGQQLVSKNWGDVKITT